MKIKSFGAAVLSFLVCGMIFAQDSDTALRYQAYLHKATELADQNDFDEAREQALKAIELKPSGAEGWLTLGVVDHVGLNANDDEALKAFKKYLKLSSNSKKKKQVQIYIGELENKLAEQQAALKKEQKELKVKQLQQTVEVEEQKKDLEKYRWLPTGTTLSSLGEMHADAQGDVYILDGTEIKKIDSKGNCINEFKTERTIQSFGVDGKGNVYVVENEKCQNRNFNGTCYYVGKYESKNKWNKSWQKQTDWIDYNFLAVSNGGDIRVFGVGLPDSGSDTGNHLFGFSSTGGGESALFPNVNIQNLTFDPSGNLFVLSATSSDGHVQDGISIDEVLDKVAGSFVKDMAIPDGMFRNFTDVDHSMAVDGKYLYVANIKAIEKFDITSGRFVEHIKLGALPLGTFYGVTVDGLGDLYICDTAGYVYKYELNN